MSEKKAKLVPIREIFLEHLTIGSGYDKGDCEKAWEEAQKHFPSYNPQSHSDLLTLEVATKDILRGIFRPELAEVKKIG